MVSTMPCCARPEVDPVTGMQILAMLMLFLLLPGITQAQPTGIQIEQAEGVMGNGIYHVNATITYQLGQEPSDALAHGIPLEFNIDLQINRQRRWFWDETIAAGLITYQVEYQPLSGQFLVTEMVNGSRHQFQNQEDVLDFIGRLREFPLVTIEKFIPDNRYYAQMKAYLNIQALPAPLRPLAYFSSQWRLMSPWQTWQVIP